MINQLFIIAPVILIGLVAIMCGVLQSRIGRLEKIAELDGRILENLIKLAKIKKNK